MALGAGLPLPSPLGIGALMMVSVGGHLRTTVGSCLALSMLSARLGGSRRGEGLWPDAWLFLEGVAWAGSLRQEGWQALVSKTGEPRREDVVLLTAGVPGRGARRS